MYTYIEYVFSSSILNEVWHCPELAEHLISEAMNQRQPCDRMVLVAVELSKPFDMVNHETHGILDSWFLDHDETVHDKLAR